MPGYSPQTWSDGDPTKPLSAARMTRIETALNDLKTVAFYASDYGVSTASSDNTSALNAAITAAFNAGGGVVILGPGNYTFLGTITIPHDPARQNAGRNSNVTIRGAGKGATALIRGADTILLDISGSSSNEWLIGFQLEDLTVFGSADISTSYSSSLVRSYYAQFVSMTNVNFRYAKGGTAFDAVQLYDSYFTNCRWDRCGSSTGAFAMNMRAADQGTTLGTFGYGTDSTNNIWFVSCVWEENWGGCVYLDGRQANGTVGNTSANQCHFVNCKMENHTGILAGPFLRLSRAAYLTINGLKIGVGGLASGQSTQKLIIVENGCYGIDAEHVTIALNETTATATNSCLKLDGTTANDSIVFRNFTCTAQTTHKPAVAFVDANGTNTNIDVRPVYSQNPGSASLWNGSTGISIYPRPGLYVKGLVDRVHAIFQKNGTQNANILEVRASDGTTVLGGFSASANLFAQNLMRGTGSPNGVVTAGKSTIFQRTDGTAGSLLYVNTDGATSWTAFA